ncbi:hypothetical protein [Terrilactibacillus laevilacticus]|uniref:Integral membrane protein n=1 Tax=Terrilactibacillus laevilacticus TaxID=1380157 RepID=A0ABW5PSC8_9BACI|nr:hypothetical protein [Terrilactibacillus laevilacticus]
MFGLKDLFPLFIGLLIIYPIVSFIHVLGHLFMAYIFGGQASFQLGLGHQLIKFGKFKVNSLYFIDSYCNYTELKWDNRITNMLVYLGGALFNIGTSILINSLVLYGVLPHHALFYQFVYFSLYFCFFSLVPVQYSKTNVSDGLAIYRILRYGSRSQIKN